MLPWGWGHWLLFSSSSVQCPRLSRVGVGGNLLWLVHNVWNSIQCRIVSTAQTCELSPLTHVFMTPSASVSTVPDSVLFLQHTPHADMRRGLSPLHVPQKCPPMYVDLQPRCNFWMANIYVDSLPPSSSTKILSLATFIRWKRTTKLCMVRASNPGRRGLVNHYTTTQLATTWSSPKI